MREGSGHLMSCAGHWKHQLNSGYNILLSDHQQLLQAFHGSEKWKQVSKQQGSEASSCYAHLRAIIAMQCTVTRHGSHMRRLFARQTSAPTVNATPAFETNLTCSTSASHSVRACPSCRPSKARRGSQRDHEAHRFDTAAHIMFVTRGDVRDPCRLDSVGYHGA